MATHHHQVQVQPQYVHYAGPPGASSTSSNSPQTATQTKTTPQAVLNGAVVSSTQGSSSTAPTPTTVAPQDTTHHHYHQYQHIVHPLPHTHAHQQQHVAQPLQYHHSVGVAQTASVTPAPVQAASTSASAGAGATTTTPPAPASAAAAAATSAGSGPLVATGDWTKDLVHLAKTAELKKHALTLQLHTAHILSAHASLEQKSKTIQDVKEQRNKLESERAKLLQHLRQVNEDRDKADMMEASIEKECADLRAKITELSDGEYAIAKRDVDRLRAELGQPPLPTLQSMLDEKKAQYLKERRINGNGNGNGNGTGSASHTPSSTPQPSHAQTGTFGVSSSIISTSTKRSAPEDVSGPSGKRPRGRPKGSKNRKTDTPGSGSGAGVGGSGSGGAAGGGTGAGGIPGTGTM